MTAVQFQAAQVRAAISHGDRVRHKTHGIGTVERIERNAFGAITRAWVWFSGSLVRVWAEDVGLLERSNG